MKLQEYIQGLSKEELQQAEAEGYAANKQPTPRVKRAVPPEVLASRKDPSRIWWDKFERSANGGSARK